MKYITSKDIVGVYSLEQGNLPASNFVNSIASIVDSDQAIENHAVLTSNPGMSPKENGAIAQEFREYKLTVPNVDYSATLKIKRKDLRRDKFDILRKRVMNLTAEGTRHDEELLFEALQSGTTSTTWDGNFLFDTTHQWGNSAVQSNLLTLSILANFGDIPNAERGTSANPSDTVMLSAIFQAIQNILGWTSDEGKPISPMAKNFQVAVPINYTRAALQAVSKDLMRSGESNGLLNSQFSVDVIATPYLTTNNRFYIWATDTAVKPFVIQRELDDKISVLDESSDYYFTHDAMLVKIENSKAIVPINFPAITCVTLTA